jgi:phosphate starvation-inducible PhoH-like protein
MSNNNLSVTDINQALSKNSSVTKIAFNKRDFKFSKNQREILHAMLDDTVKIVIIDGPAGVGKSYLSVYAALKAYQEQDFKDILYLRTVIESASKSMGYLAGDENAKFSNYKAILDSKVEEIVEVGSRSGLPLKAAPINFLRGQNWVDHYVIADEIQNFSIDEVKTLMTRIGKGSKLIMCGDSQQSDIKGSGLETAKQIFDTPECVDKGINFFQLTSDDIVRSEIVKFIVKKFEDFEEMEREYNERTRKTPPAYASF